MNLNNITILLLAIVFVSIQIIEQKQTDSNNFQSIPSDYRLYPNQKEFLEANVDFSAFLNLAVEVDDYRKSRLVDYNEWKDMLEDSLTIILDTRSLTAYEEAHIKGAIHLDFSDFTSYKLGQLIPNKTTRILIYCNNNFYGEWGSLAGPKGPMGPKGMVPVHVYVEAAQKTDSGPMAPNGSPVALNIPTFINLYHYGYRNVYELSSLINIKYMQNNEKMLEGTKVKKHN